MSRGRKKWLFFDCPDCGQDTNVKPTSQRRVKAGRIRYRICPHCDAYFTTVDDGGGEQFSYYVDRIDSDYLDDFEEDPDLLEQLSEFWEKIDGRR